jgi:hypothetical protein
MRVLAVCGPCHSHRKKGPFPAKRVGKYDDSHSDGEGGPAKPLGDGIGNRRLDPRTAKVARAADSATAAIFSGSLSHMAVPASEKYMPLVGTVALLMGRDPELLSAPRRHAAPRCTRVALVLTN